MQRSPVIRHLDVIRALLVVDFVLVAAFLANRGFDYPFGVHVARVLDVGEESSLATWYSSIKLMGVAALLLLMARVLRLGGERVGVWGLQAALGGFVLALSVDEIILGHETLGMYLDRWWLPTGRRADSWWFHYSGIWVVIAVPVALAALAAVWRLARAWGDRTASLCLAAGFVALFGGAGSDFLTSFTGETGPLATLQLAFEEGLEMLGATLLMGGAWRLLESRGLRLFAVGVPAKAVIGTRAGDAGAMVRAARRYVVVEGSELRDLPRPARPQAPVGRRDGDEAADALLDEVANR